MQIKNSNLDYFLKCPYCRNIQFTILPEYEDLGLEKKYGINSLDPSLPSKTQQSYINHNGVYYGHDNFTFMMYGVLFKKGICCEQILDSSLTNPVYKKCSGKYCAQIPNTELNYCKYHYKKGLKDLKISEKNKIMEEKKKQNEEKIKIMEEKKKLKENQVKEKQQKFEEINKERIANGLQPLKRLTVKKKIENIVKPGEPISIFIPEMEENNELLCCKAILKTGINKGKTCGSKLVNENCLCNRHNKN